MKQHKQFKYKVGEIYLHKNHVSNDYEEPFFYAIKQIIDLDFSVTNQRMYQYIYHCKILNCQTYGWDYEKNVDEGKMLLQEYLNAKKNEK